MMLDAFLTLSDAQAMAGGSTTVCTNKYDLGLVSPRRDPGAGDPLAIVVTIDVAAATTGDTFEFQTVSDEDSALGSPTIHNSRTLNFDDGTLPAGAIVVLDIPQGPPNYERYLGYRVIVSAGGSVTCSAYIVPRSFIPKLKTYAKGYVIN